MMNILSCNDFISFHSERNCTKYTIITSLQKIQKKIHLGFENKVIQQKSYIMVSAVSCQWSPTKQLVPANYKMLHIRFEEKS